MTAKGGILLEAADNEWRANIIYRELAERLTDAEELALLAWRWSGLLTATLNEELAQAAGLDPRREKLALVIALALVVAVAIKIVGALLIAALLIIPAATAHNMARSPEAMAAGATGVGIVSVLGGLWGSLRFDTPAGPSIVVAAAFLFVLGLAFGTVRR